ncbi:MAG: OsmC-like protein [Firmicutes bacterium ADurb.Bin193]|nr:MAG: OsmC-like protein [Firmicutes bacterium ADurb.Bin193]
MNMAPLEISLELTDQKVGFRSISKTNPDTPVMIDYSPPLGDGQGFLGLELLVMSFAGCVSTGIVAILRRMGKSIAGYRMSAAGIRRENPLSLEKIRFEVMLEAAGVSEEELQNAVRKAEEISPVWLAVKNNVEVEWQCKVTAAPERLG